jgi:hypothetical protein
MTEKELFHLTGKCLVPDEHPGFRQYLIEKMESGSIDWQQFVTYCSNHLILPVIYLKFKSQDLLPFLPEELTEHLKEIYDLNVARNNLISIQLQAITQVLNQQNIYPLFLKGSGNLLDGLYADPGERILGDIDFLVPEKDYLTTARLLEGQGYTTVSPIADYTYIGTLKHYPPLSHPDFTAFIEIHRVPVQEKVLRWFNTGIIDLKKLTVASLKGCFVLSDEHKIILNFIHSQISNMGNAYGVVSFRDLYDLYLLSGRTPVKDTLPHIREKRKAKAYFVFAGNALGLRGKFYPEINLASWFFLKKHELNMSSDFFYYTNRNIHFISHQLFNQYIGQIIQSLYSPQTRQSLLGRLSNRNWYKTHLNYYLGFFSRNNNSSK